MLEDAQNKMLKAAPAKKGWHFPGDDIHFAEFIEAETIEEATALYHQIKRVIADAVAAANSPAAGLTDVSTPSPEQSAPGEGVE